MLQLTRSGVRFAKDAGLAAQRAAFHERDCVILHAFVEPALLEVLMPLLEAGDFRMFEHTKGGSVFARELRLQANDRCATLLAFLTNQPALFRAIADFSGCEGALRAFYGRCWKRSAADAFFDSWHTDWVRGQRLALSINLQPHPVTGGELELRNKSTGEQSTWPCPPFGSARLFRLGPHLEHRVLAATGPTPLVQYAGWFATELRPGFRTVIPARERRARSAADEAPASSGQP